MLPSSPFSSSLLPIPFNRTHSALLLTNSLSTHSFKPSLDQSHSPHLLNPSLNQVPVAKLIQPFSSSISFHRFRHIPITYISLVKLLACSPSQRIIFISLNLWCEGISSLWIFVHPIARHKHDFSWSVPVCCVQADQGQGRESPNALSRSTQCL